MSTKTTNTISQTVMPSWYTNYAQQVLSNQQALSSQPYQAYSGPRVAGFNTTQQQGFDATKTAANAGQGALQQAQTQLGATTNRSGLSAAQPYLNTASGMSALGAASPYFSAASGMSALGAAQPNLGTAADLASASVNPLGMQMAMPYLTAASGSSVDNIDAYMNPYMQDVLDRIGDLGTRTLQEKILPGITDEMIGAGQFGGTRQAEMMGRAVRDAMGEISAQQSAALQSGWNTAQQAAANDLSRYASLAGTAGNLGTAQQGALASAAGTFSNLGSTLGQLTEADRSALAQMGLNLGNLTEADRSALLNIGSQTGSLYNQDTSNQQQSASTLAQIAAQQQQMALAGANAVTAVGNQQQANQQSNLDVAYQNYLAQQKYAQDQQNAMLATLQGVSGAVPTASASVSSSKTPSASILQQLVGGLSTAAGVGSMLGLGGTGSTSTAAPAAR